MPLSAIRHLRFAAILKSTISKLLPAALLASPFCLQSPLQAQTADSPPSGVSIRTPGAVQPSSMDKARILAEYANLPLGFEPSADGNSQEFVARTAGGSARLTGKVMALTLQRPVSAPKATGSRPVENPLTLQVKLEGANPATHARTIGKLPGNANYFTGDDQKLWRTGVPTFGKVEYTNIYPGIDLLYYGNRSGRLEHDFILKPGADPAVIQISLDGAESAQLLQDGDLQIGLKSGLGTESATLVRPVAYQEEDGRRMEIAVNYAMNDAGLITFHLGSYDHSRELVIDPVLDYSTFFGGGILSSAYGVAVDAGGNAYIVGHSGVGGSIPTTKGSYDPNCDDCSAAFAAKLNPTGTALLYSTYLSGGLFDQANSVAVDSSGAAYVAGITESAGFPVTKGAIQTKFGGAFSNAFVTKLNPAGSALEYSTFLGGNGPSKCYSEAVGAQADHAMAIAVDTAGDAYVTGCTSSTNFPVTKSAFEKSCGGCDAGYASAFVSKLNPTGTELLYSTFLGGNGLDYGYGIAVDKYDNAYVTGSTTSTNLKVTSAAYQKHINAAGGQNAFVLKLVSSGDTADYYTYLGGDTVDGGYAIAVNVDLEAYVTGYASSPNFPTTSGAYQRSCHDCASFETGFVTELNSSGSGLVFSTFLGGSGFDALTGIALDSKNDVFVTGITQSTNFPVSSNAYKKTCSQCSTSTGKSSAVLTELNPAGTELTYSTYLGGSDSENGTALTVDTAGNAYVVGQVTSTNFPVSAGAVQPSCSACGDDSAAFLTKFYFGTAAPSLTFSEPTLSFGNQALKQSSSAKDLTLKNSGSGPLEISSFKVTGNDPGDFAGEQDCRAVIPPGVSCIAAVIFTPAELGYRSAYLDVYDSQSGSPQSAKLSGTGVKPVPAATFSPTSLNLGDVMIDTVGTGTITLKNTGTADLTVSAASFTGADASDFGGNTTCSGSLSPGGACTFTIGIEPTKVQTYTADLNVTTNASTTPVKIPLSATGIADAPIAKLSKTTIDFPTESVGTQSPGSDITLTNTGAKTLTFKSISIVGTDPKDFSGEDNCGSGLTAGSSCVIEVFFKPTAAGARTATLEITDNASGSPQKVTLNGTGK
jgi:hypothetical protein